MGFVLGIVSILLGVLAASSFIVSKFDGAEETIEKLRPLQGWLGIVGCAWGLYFLVSFLFGSLGKFSALPMLVVVRGLGTSAVLAATGFLMGFSMISNMLADSKEAKRRADEVYETLATWQVPLGIAAIVLGVVAIFA